MTSGKCLPNSHQKPTSSSRARSIDCFSSAEDRQRQSGSEEGHRRRDGHPSVRRQRRSEASRHVAEGDEDVDRNDRWVTCVFRQVGCAPRRRNVLVMFLFRVEG